VKEEPKTQVLNTEPGAPRNEEVKDVTEVEEEKERAAEEE